MFNLSTIYIFNPVRGCEGRSPNALLFPGGYNADGPGTYGGFSKATISFFKSSP